MVRKLERIREELLPTGDGRRRKTLPAGGRRVCQRWWRAGSGRRHGKLLRGSNMEAQQKPCHRGVGVTRPPPLSRTSNLLLPRQRPATKTAPDSTKNKTADRCRYCDAERSLLPSSPPPPPPGGGEKQPLTILTKRSQTGRNQTWRFEKGPKRIWDVRVARSLGQAADVRASPS